MYSSFTVKLTGNMRQLNSVMKYVLKMSNVAQSTDMLTAS